MESVLDRTSGLDKAAPKVALVEFSNPLPVAAFTVLAAEGSEAGRVMALKSSSPNSTKVRARTPNLVTPKQALRAILSTLTHVASNTGSK